VGKWIIEKPSGPMYRDHDTGAALSKFPEEARQRISNGSADRANQGKYRYFISFANEGRDERIGWGRLMLRATTFH
jgi:hypothetical protein